MPYITRNMQNEIIAVYKDKTDIAEEFLSADDPELLAFISGDDKSKELLRSKLTQTDIQMIRVLEDLIDTLISKEVITIADLPIDVINKLQDRKSIRSQLKMLSDLLLDSDE